MTVVSIWQEVEFGSYEADLPLWEELASACDGPVLELGAGAGRVALHLAARGHQLIAVEQNPELTDDLQLKSRRLGLPLSVVAADLTGNGDLPVPSRPGLAIGALHVIQVFDQVERRRLMTRLAALLAPGATLAMTVVDESTLLSAGAASTQILPDMREVDGWVFSSEPLWVQVGDEALTIRRLRELVSPGGQMKRMVHDERLNRVSPDALEREAEAAGFAPAGRRQISSGPDEADSIAVLLEAPA